MKKYLVTGASGFIGSQVCHKFLDQGHQVVGIDNMNDYYDVRLKEYRIGELNKHERFTFVKEDIENLSYLESLFREHSFEAVINLAARAGVRYSMENPHVYMSTNAQGTLNLLECMKLANIKKMVLASTSSLYAGQKMPFDESLPVNTPISPYAASKKAAEAMTYSYHHLYEMDISVLRFFTVYGPAGRPDMCIFRFIKWIDEGLPIELFGDGMQSRDFTYVDDVANGVVLATKNVGHEVINIGGGNDPVSLLEIIKELERLLGKTAKIENKEFHKADIVTTKASIEKANKILNWKPSVLLKDGLKMTVDWYLENRSWLKDVQL